MEQKKFLKNAFKSDLFPMKVIRDDGREKISFNLIKNTDKHSMAKFGKY